MKKLFISFCILFLFTLSSYSQDYSKLISEIDRLTDSILANTKQPGLIVSITKDDKIIYEKAKGLSDALGKTPMDLKMRFRIGSVTKTFTTSVILQLVDEGKLKLDETIDKYFPRVPNGKNITVRMLGDMSSGLYNYSEDKAFNDSMLANPKRKWKAEELVEWSIRKGTYFEPGKGWHYSNTNTVLLGMLIEKLTGNSLESEIKKRIIDKLNLKETEYPSGPQITGFHSHGYGEDETPLPLPLQDVTEKYDPSWGGAAGAIISSLADLKIYIKSLGEGKLTSKESHQERMKWSLDKGFLQYGFGIFNAGGYLGHNGSYPGFHNVSVHSPSTGITAIIFYNTQSDIDPDILLKDILSLLK